MPIAFRWTMCLASTGRPAGSRDTGCARPRSRLPALRAVRSAPGGCSGWPATSGSWSRSGAGNEAAFEVAFERHGKAILSFCRHMLGSLEEAEDAVQHTFAAAYQDLLRSPGREIALKPWLFAIARNRCLSLLRGKREQPDDFAEPPAAALLGADRGQGRAAAAAGRPARAAGRAACGAPAHGDRRPVAGRDRARAGLRGGAREGARVSCPQDAPRPARCPRHSLRADPGEAGQPPRWGAETQRAPPPPARMRGLPHVPRPGPRAARAPGRGASRGSLARAQVGRARRDRDRGRQWRRCGRPRVAGGRGRGRHGEAGGGGGGRWRGSHHGSGGARA